MRINATTYKTDYVLYMITSTAGELLHVRIDKLTDMLLLGGLKFPDGLIDVTMIETDVDRLKLANKAVELAGDDIALRNRIINMVELWKRKERRILCIDTGEIFDSAAAISRQHSVAASNLCNHLNGAAGYKTINGKTYRRI